MSRSLPLVGIFVLVLTGAAAAQEITWSTLDGGGGEVTGGNYRLQWTIAQPDPQIVSGGNYTLYGGFWVDGNVATSVQEDGIPGAPRVFALHAPSPNPFNPRTTVAFDLPKSGPVRVEVINVRGQRVRTLVNESRPAGEYQMKWDGTDNQGNQVGSGVYFVRMTAQSFGAVQKVTMIK